MSTSDGYTKNARHERKRSSKGAVKKMGIGTSIVVFAIGAIMRFATTVHTTNFNIHTIGVILMIVGAVGTVLSLVFWSSWGGFHRREVYDREEYDDGRSRRVVDEYR